MKTYKTVQEWLESNPSKEVVERVLNTINRGATTEARKVLYHKTVELNKVQKTIKAMEAIKFPVGPEINKMVKELEKEIASIKKELPVVVKKVETKKEE